MITPPYEVTSKRKNGIAEATPLSEKALCCFIGVLFYRAGFSEKIYTLLYGLCLIEEYFLESKLLTNENYFNSVFWL